MRLADEDHQKPYHSACIVDGNIKKKHNRQTHWLIIYKNRNRNNNYRLNENKRHYAGVNVTSKWGENDVPIDEEGDEVSSKS